MVDVNKLVLKLSDLLPLAFLWEREPLAEQEPYLVEKENIFLPRQKVIKSVKELIPVFKNESEDFFKHADGWLRVRIGAAAILEEQLKSQQPSQEQLVKWSEDMDKARRAGEQAKTHLGEYNSFVKEHEEKVGLEDAKNEADKLHAEKLQPKQEMPIVGAELRRTPQEVAHAEIPASRVQTKRPVAESNSLLARWKSFTQNPLGEIKKLFTSNRTAEKTTEVVGSSQLANLRTFFSNPIGNVVNFFRGNRQATVATSVTKKVAAEAGKQVVKKAATGLATKGAVAVAGGAATGGIATVLMLAKELLTNKDLQNMLKDLVSKGSIAVAGLGLLIWNFLSANFIGASIGGFLGGAIGLVGGPIGVFGGSLGGALFGAQIQASIMGSGIFGTAGSASAIGSSAGGIASGGVAPAASISFAGFTIPANVASTLSGIGSFLGSSWVAQLAGVGIVGGIGTLILSITLTFAALLQTPEEQQTNQGQSQEAIFTLKKESLTPEFPVYDEGPITAQYKLTIQQQKNPITILSITDKFTRSNSSSWSQNLSVPVSQNTYSQEISGPEFKNTYLYNLVTVKVKDNVTGKEETKTASSKVKIGQPVEQKKQPYGYPVGGVITTVDDDIMPSGGLHSSCFMNFSPCQWFNGGLDIAPGAGDHTVKATMAGKVIKSKYDRSSSPLSDVGGVVYIQSDDGLYITEYMHLDQDGLVSQDKTVSRGEPIGKVYDNPSNKLGGGQYGAHLHYQVLFNDANLLFNDTLKTGSCSEEKYLEALPVQWQTVPSGPFVCQ